jgi:biopolymer transport protein TolR
MSRMAGGMDLGGSNKGGKKPLDAMLNLVPFIDLMAVTIVFLIMTAVWTQLGRLQVSQTGGHHETPIHTAMPLTLRITGKELRLRAGSAEFEPFLIRRDERGRIDVTQLFARLKELKVQQPDQFAITLSTDDAVRYDDLIRVIDTVRMDGTEPLFPSIAVEPTFD